MATQMTVQEALALAKSYETSPQKPQAVNPEVSTKPQDVQAVNPEVSTKPQDVQAVKPEVQAKPEVLNPEVTPKLQAATKPEAPPKLQSSAKSEVAQNARAGLADFAARLLSAQSALDKSQVKFYAAMADLEEKKSALLKATEDIQNSVMRATGERSFSTRSDSVSFAKKCRQYFCENKNKIISAKDIEEYTGEKNSSKIFMTLQDMMKTGGIVRVSRGRYRHSVDVKEKPF